MGGARAGWSDCEAGGGGLRRVATFSALLWLHCRTGDCCWQCFVGRKWGTFESRSCCSGAGDGPG